ncbi:MAG TPA: chemotaxis protein CheX [Bryobacteraceae bacterium]|nr:chemotaxis protein CheX [Bryobacteraceae bacterium]
MFDEQLLHEKLVTATESVLETMFFTAVLLRGAVQNSHGPLMQVHVPFLGYPSGELHIAIEESAARVMTQDFLPEDAEGASMEDTMCEFASMTCGAFLSEIESASGFKLLSPVVTPAAAAVETFNGPLVEEGFTLESGSLVVGVRFAYE